ncbi:PIN-like domain-containing protein [Serratia ureilytica]|uniref:PIN-like domain-containing protein n=1 Tax=Serratia ureilytica TaxID=300181 RepID=UPI00384CEA63
MKNIFSGFYSLNDEKVNSGIWNSKDTLFIFDTNCLLNLYRCEDVTRDDILSVMSKISDRIWIPFFVCLEYQKNRRDVITESIDNLALIRDSLNEISTSVVASLSKGKVKKYLYNSLSESIHNLKDDIKPLIDKFISEHIDSRISNKKEIACKDVIRDRIDAIVIDRCGTIPSIEWIKNVNKAGATRFENKIPPGFMDEKKTGKKFYSDLEFEERYGDLYIWQEIIEKAKDDSIKNVIFVCDDLKKDWWYEKKGITHGALEALQTEIYSKSNIKNFKLLSQSTFLHDAQKHLPNINIDSKSLKEMQEVDNIIFENYYDYVELNDKESDFNEKTIPDNNYSITNERFSIDEFISERNRRRLSSQEYTILEIESVMNLTSKLTSSMNELNRAYELVKLNLNKSTIPNQLKINYHVTSEDLNSYCDLLHKELKEAYNEKRGVMFLRESIRGEIEITLLKCKETINSLLSLI